MKRLFYALVTLIATLSLVYAFPGHASSVHAATTQTTVVPLACNWRVVSLNV